MPIDSAVVAWIAKKRRGKRGEVTMHSAGQQDLPSRGKAFVTGSLVGRTYGMALGAVGAG